MNISVVYYYQRFVSEDAVTRVRKEREDELKRSTLGNR